jgi:hypothetical protein
MAATTLSAILTRFRTACEASPCSLTQTGDTFTHDRQPNAALTNSYRLEDAGTSQNLEATNNVAVRVDRVTVWIAQKVNFAGPTAEAAIEDKLVSIERAILADGPSNSYHARLESRRVSRPAGKDWLVGSASFSVDYDYATTA